MKKVLLLSAFLIVISINIFAECDMFGMLSTQGTLIANIDSILDDYPVCGGNDPEDYLVNFFEYEIGQNTDGYGIIYYKNNSTSLSQLEDYMDPSNQVFREADSTDETMYTWAKRTIFDFYGDETEAVVVLGHARDATCNPGIVDPHPFIWDYEAESNPSIPHYTFEHNGSFPTDEQTQLESMLFDLYPGWVTTLGYEYKTPTMEGSDGTVVDSEIYFHWIMANITACNGNVLLGLHNATKPLRSWDGRINFIFSDGEALYGYRNCGDAANPNNYYLGYYDGTADNTNNFRAIRSDNAYSLGLTYIPEYSLAYIPRDGDIVIYPFFDTTPYGTEVSGIVLGNWDANNSPYIVSGDIIVNSTLTIEAGAEVFFADEYSFTINGQVNLEDGSSLNLSKSSEVIIESGGELFLNWGSTISGFTATTHPSETITIPGDRIISRNGGRITSGDLTDYAIHPNYPNVPSIIIKSNSDKLWDGIFIESPNQDQEFWFVNCDIAGVNKLSMGEGESFRNIADLNLYYTDFHDAGQINVQDDHKLTINGDANNYCYIYGNHVAPIYLAEAGIDLKYVWIGAEETLGYAGNNGTGVSILDGSGEDSIISNCIIRGNNGSGVRLDGSNISFTENLIEENDAFGMICFKGTLFNIPDDFTYIDICNNGFAEYAGWRLTYQMTEESNDINLNDAIGDLAVQLDWDIEHPVDVQGTNLNSSDISRLYPSNLDAWIFNRPISPIRELLLSASYDIAEENYTIAENTLKQLIFDYPLSLEAGSAVYYLYHLTNKDEKQFYELINYLETLTPELSSSLYSAKKSIITKCYMKEKDYITAIAFLEDIIQNSEVPDEVICALMEQGYNYYKLVNSGNRSRPQYCSIRTSSIDDYLLKTKELETRFSYMQDLKQEQKTDGVEKILTSNYPNPFNPTTKISFNIANDSNVLVEVYNIKGQKVKTLLNQKMIAGNNSVVWNGEDTNCKTVSSGVYFYKVETNNATAMKKIILLK